MIKMRLLLLLFPALVASIDVEMAGKINLKHKYLYGGYTVRGIDHRLARDNDRVIFHILDQELETAIEWYFDKKPDRIILTRDSPWGDVYKKNQWNPLEVRLQAGPPELVEITTENVPLVVTKSIYENPSKSVTRNVNLTESGTTSDSATSLWMNPKGLEGNDVNIRFNIEAEDGFSSMEHTCAFGRNRRTTSNKFRSQTYPLELDPSERVLVQLEVKKGTLRFRVPYTASLTGVIAVHYKPNHKNADFHGLDVQKILDASHRNATLTVYQSISYEFYYGQTLKVHYGNDRYTVIKNVAPEVKKSSGNRRKAAIAKHAADTGKKITVKEGTKPFEFTEEELKAVVDQVMENQLDEESSESTERVDTAHATEKH